MAVYDVPATSFGYIDSRSAVYADAREGTGSKFVFVSPSGVQGLIGQTQGSSFGYICYETFLSFDLSDFVTITAVELHLALQTGADNTTTAEFTLEARPSAWTPPLTTAQFVAGSALAALPLAATYDSTPGFATPYFVLTDVDLLANCPPGGTAQFLLCSDRHRAGTNPGAPSQEYIVIQALASGNDKPKLVVTGTKPGNWSVGSLPLA